MKSKKFSIARLSVIAIIFFAIALSGGICNAQVTVTLSSSAGTLSPTGTATLTAVVGGTAMPLKYRFSGTNTGGVVFVDSVNPCTITGPGIYTVLVTDTFYTALGEASDTIYSTIGPSGSFTIIDSAYSCAGALGGGEVVLNYTGFFVPVNLTFSPLGPFALSGGINGEPFQDTIAGFVPGPYTLKITDALGQEINTNISMPVSTAPDFSSYITASPDTILPGQTDTITIHFQGGIPPYSAFVQWESDTTGITINTPDSVYSFTTLLPGIWKNAAAIDVGVGTQPRCDINGGQVQVYVNCGPGQCVWPGDANDDGVTNNLDLLAIGLGYDSTGPVRPDTSITYTPHYAPDWNDSLQDTINYKFMDCNGNGIINANDTLAIIQNYSLAHPRSYGYDAPRSGAPLLYPSVSEDTAYNGDTLTVQFILGDSTAPANNVYGMAFTFNYDALVVDTSKTRVTFGNSWLGTSTDKISIAKDFKLTGQLECAVTRIDHTTKSGQGAIGVATFVITTDNINGKTYSYHTSHFYISGITMIDSMGNILPVNAGHDSTLVGYLPTGINHAGDINNLIHIYPNPANSKLEISSAQLAMEQIKISDVLGNEVMGNVYSPGEIVTRQQLDISNLTPGIYLVQVLTGKGVAIQKLVIAR